MLGVNDRLSNYLDTLIPDQAHTPSRSRVDKSGGAKQRRRSQRSSAATPVPTAVPLAANTVEPAPAVLPEPHSPTSHAHSDSAALNPTNGAVRPVEEEEAMLANRYIQRIFQDLAGHFPPSRRRPEPDAKLTLAIAHIPDILASEGDEAGEQLAAAIERAARSCAIDLPLASLTIEDTGTGNQSNETAK
ncbi:hypothetical protein FRB90_005195 [Tulasnella sp. 427]|nr:hypothetical protein FRB90_005195 [Tulasnella sp. 427]